MYSCVLIPRELSLVLTFEPSSSHPPPAKSPAPSALPRPSPVLSTRGSVWSNSPLRPGTVFYPDEGEVRLDKLDSRVTPPDDDVRRSYGGYDTVLNVQGQHVRHCNWVRFVRSTLEPGSANVISSKVRGQAFFQVTQPVKANEEIVVLFHAERAPVQDMGTAGLLLDSDSTRERENRVSPSEQSQGIPDPCDSQRYRPSLSERLSGDVKRSSPSSSPSSPGFPHDLRTQGSWTSSLPSSAVSSTLALPVVTMTSTPAVPSLFPAPVPFGGLGFTGSLYNHLALMSMDQQQQQQQHQYEKQKQHQHVQQQEHSSHCEREGHQHRDNKMNDHQNPRISPSPRGSLNYTDSFGVGDGLLTSTPISMVTPLQRRKLSKIPGCEKDIGEENGSDYTDEHEAEKDKTPIINPTATLEKMNSHNPRSLQFGSSLSSSSSMSVSVVSSDSPHLAAGRNESSNCKEEADNNIDDSLRDFSASSPMFTSGSSRSREISSASEACAGEISGINLSMDKESIGPCTSSSQYPRNHENPNTEFGGMVNRNIDKESRKHNQNGLDSDTVAQCDQIGKREIKTKDEKEMAIDSDQERPPAELDVLSRNPEELGRLATRQVKSEEINDGDDDDNAETEGRHSGQRVKAQDSETMGTLVDSTVDCGMEGVHDRGKENEKGDMILKAEENLPLPTSDGHISSSSSAISGTTGHHQQQRRGQKYEADCYSKPLENNGTAPSVGGQTSQIDKLYDTPSLADSAYSTIRVSPIESHRDNIEHRDFDPNSDNGTLERQPPKNSFRRFSYNDSQTKEITTLEVPQPRRGLSNHHENLSISRDAHDAGEKDKGQGRFPQQVADPQVEPQNLSMSRLTVKPPRVDIKIPEAKPQIVSPSQSRDNRQPMKRCRERTWWPCDVCGKKFDRPSLLKRHTRTHTGEKPHACDVCGKAFSTSSSLNTHRRIHSGEKPHQCKICGKRFTASSNLYYHRMTHNKEKPHKCDLCSKSFPTPGDLRSHMYIHNGSWPFRCEVCNRGFSKQTNLKNHMLLHSGDKPHECSRCGKKFALLCNLKTHLKTHEHSDSSDASGSHCSVCGGTQTLALLPLDGHEETPDSRTAGENWTSRRCSCKARTTDAILSAPAKRSHHPGHGRQHHHTAPGSDLALPKKRHTDFSISKLTAADDNHSQRDDRNPQEQDNVGTCREGRFSYVKSGKPEHAYSEDEDREITLRKMKPIGYDNTDVGKHFGGRLHSKHGQPLGLISSNLNTDKIDVSNPALDGRRPTQARSPSSPFNKAKSSAYNYISKHGGTLASRDTYQDFLAAAAAAAAAAEQNHHHQQQQQQQQQQFHQPWLLSAPQLSAYNQLAYPLLFSAPNLQQIGALSAVSSPTAHLKQDFSAPSPFHPPLDSQGSLKAPPSTDNLQPHQQQQQQLLRLAHQHHAQQQQILPLLPPPTQNLVASAAPLSAADMTSMRGGGVMAPGIPLGFQLHPGAAQLALASHALAQGF